MLSPAELAYCRQTHELVMVDACTIRHPGGTAGTFNPDTGTTDVVPHPPFYTGACAAQDDPAAARELLVAEQEVTLEVTVVRAPWDVVDVVEGDLVTLTQSADPVLMGRGEMTVAKVQASTFATARRLLCTKV